MQTTSTRSRHALALLAFLLAVVDVLGGLTSLWTTEFVRTVTARVRLPFDLLTLAVAGADIASGTHNWLTSIVLTRILPLLIGMVTLAGAIAAAVCPPPDAHPPSPPTPAALPPSPPTPTPSTMACGHHEWIFAVESSGVVLLLILWAVWTRPCAPSTYEEERARLTPDDCVRMAHAALSAQRKAIHQSEGDGVAAAQQLGGALSQLEDAGLDGSGLYLGVLQELARVRLDQGHADEAAALMARVVAGCEAGLTIEGHAAVNGRGAAEDVTHAREELAHVQALAAERRRSAESHTSTNCSGSPHGTPR